MSDHCDLCAANRAIWETAADRPLPPWDEAAEEAMAVLAMRQEDER